jgi:uncharacterized repeat protein (TIGR03803 family)
MRNVFLSVAVVLLSCSCMLGQAQYKVLWTFTGFPNDGAEPFSNLVLDKTGNLYGTTAGGGSLGSGMVFRLSPNQDGSWTNTILYSFCSQFINNRCQDGAYPQAGLIFDAQGNLYGTTVNGGAVGCPEASAGCGTVFELLPPSSQGGPWTETVLYNFCTNNVNDKCLDGGEPVSQLTIDTSGNLYGTTPVGGTGDGVAGTVFELSHGAGGWTETVLYNFCSLGEYPVCPDGYRPQAGVTFDQAGNLYGTTEAGGSQRFLGGGIVFKLSRGANGWTETVLHSFFSPVQAGGTPLGGVSFDTLGNLYGTFSGGGPAFAGGGFRLSKNGGFGKFFFNNTDGNEPAAGVLVDSKHAALYATTRVGGSGGRGTVVKIVAPQQESVLYNFCSQPNCADGAGPVASVISDTAGNLYGTTRLGGANGLGVVFEIIQQAPKRPAGQAALRSLLNEKR